MSRKNVPKETEGIFQEQTLKENLKNIVNVLIFKTKKNLKQHFRPAKNWAFLKHNSLFFRNQIDLKHKIFV